MGGEYLAWKQSGLSQISKLIVSASENMLDKVNVVDCEDKLNRTTAHLQLLLVAQKYCMQAPYFVRTESQPELMEPFMTKVVILEKHLTFWQEKYLISAAPMHCICRLVDPSSSDKINECLKSTRTYLQSDWWKLCSQRCTNLAPHYYY